MKNPANQPDRRIYLEITNNNRHEKKLFMEILIFKTNLTDIRRISDIESSLNIHPNIFQWNVDLHDNDNILRVVANDIAGEEVENMLLNAGYYCEELK